MSTPVARYLAGEDAVLDEPLRADAARARAFLAGAEPPSSLAPDVGRAVVEVLAARRDVDRLAALAVRGDRALAKEARRGLHALRSRGVAAAVPAREEDRRAAPPVAVADADESWVAAPGGAGERFLAFLQVQPGGGGTELVWIELDAQGALREAQATPASRKRWRDLRRDAEAHGEVLARFPRAEALELVEEAYARTLALGRALPPRFAAARAALGGPWRRPPEVHQALRLVEPGARPSAADAAALHALQALAGWVAPDAIYDKLSLALDEVETSRLLVDDRQRGQARMAAIDRAIEEAWEEPARARAVRRLLDTALVLHRAGRREDAARARAQADALVAPDFSPVADPFARALVEKGLVPEALDAGLVRPGDEVRDARAPRRDGRLILPP